MLRLNCKKRTARWRSFIFHRLSTIYYPLSTIFFLLPLLLFVPGCNLMGFAADKAGEYATQMRNTFPRTSRRW